MEVAIRMVATKKYLVMKQFYFVLKSSIGGQIYRKAIAIVNNCFVAVKGKGFAMKA